MNIFLKSILFALITFGLYAQNDDFDTMFKKGKFAQKEKFYDLALGYYTKAFDKAHNSKDFLKLITPYFDTLLHMKKYDLLLNKGDQFYFWEISDDQIKTEISFCSMRALLALKNIEGETSGGSTFDKAKKVYERLGDTPWRIPVRHGIFLQNFGTILASSGHSEDAIAIYDEALAIDDLNEVNMVNLELMKTKTFVDLGNLVTAKENGLKVLKSTLSNKSKIKVGIGLAKVLKNSEQYNDTISICRTLLRKYPLTSNDRLACYLLIADSYFYMGKFIESLQTIESCLADDAISERNKGRLAGSLRLHRLQVR